MAKRKKNMEENNELVFEEALNVAEEKTTEEIESAQEELIEENITELVQEETAEVEKVESFYGLQVGDRVEVFDYTPVINGEKFTILYFMDNETSMLDNGDCKIRFANKNLRKI